MSINKWEDRHSPTGLIFATPHLIIEAVAAEFCIPYEDIKGRKRDEDTAMARQAAMYLIRQLLNLSLEETGKELGGRTPATVTWGYSKIANLLPKPSLLSKKILLIQKEMTESWE